MATIKKSAVDAELRVPPKDETAEQKFLSALMLDGSALQRVTQEFGRIEESEFYSEKHRLIYGAILRRSEISDNFEPTVIIFTFVVNGLLDKDRGSGYLAQL